MRQTRDCDHVVSHGTLRDGMSRVDYYTTAPTPSQWIAVGVLVSPETEDPIRRPRRMLVGTGRCEKDAVADLEERFTHLNAERRPGRPRRESRLEASIQQPGRAARRPGVHDVISGPSFTAENEASRI